MKKWAAANVWSPRPLWNFCPGAKLSCCLAYFAGQKFHSQQFANVRREQLHEFFTSDFGERIPRLTEVSELLLIGTWGEHFLPDNANASK